GIAFLLGLEFIALLFFLVYAGAIAVLVLFVVMMLDVKAIENPWSAKKKRLLYVGGLIFFLFLIAVGWSEELQNLIKLFATTYIGSLVLFNVVKYEEYIKENFQSIANHKIVEDNLNKVNNISEFEASNKKVQKTFIESVDEKVDSWFNLCDSEGLTEFFRLLFHKESVNSSFTVNKMWFVEFDSSCALNDPSYLLYSTYAILLIIAGVILLIAMVGAISLTLQKNCPESLYRQLGRESKNAVFLIKEKKISRDLKGDNLDVLS
ncbi:unnamed protein product, partial [Ectocarpus sp. 12 AP-2014]